MASISANGSKAHHKFTLEVTQSATNIANNTSTLSFSFKLSPLDNGGWDFYEWGQLIAYTVTINGTNYTGYIPDYNGTSVLTLKSGTQSVGHNSDGTKSISYSFSVTDYTGANYTTGNASASGTFTLTRIPRATTPTFSAKTVTMGSSITITMTPAASTFKHKLRYSWSTVTNSVNGISIGENFTAPGTTTATFTPPTSLANYIPNNSSGVCTVICYTYDASGNHIGTVNTQITLAVPSYTPTGSIAITGTNLLSSTYVQGKSKMSVTITAATSYGATITGYSSVVDGKTYSGKTFTTNALSSGSKSVVTTITDSRGKTATITSTAYTVYAYSAPQITSFTLVRQSDGTSVVATVKGSIASVNSKNAKTIKVTLNGVTNTITSSSYTINGTTTFTSVPTDSTFTGTASFTDSYTTVSQNSTLPTVAVTMDFLNDGKGVAFGKVAETSGLLDIAWKAKIGGSLNVDKGAVIETALEVTSPTFGATMIKRNDSAQGAAIKFSNTNGVLGSIGMTATKDGGLIRWGSDTTYVYNVLDTGNTKDYVVSQTTYGDWYYTKWNSGKAEAWRKITVGNVSLTTSMATGVWSNDTHKARDISLPSGLFIDAPYAFINATSSGYTITQVSNTTTDTISYRLWAPYSATIANCIIFLYVLGRWK